MPDVLGMTPDALCPDATCELAHNETGLAEPCEHQLDLLVVSVPTQKSRNLETMINVCTLIFFNGLWKFFNSQHLITVALVVD